MKLITFVVGCMSLFISGVAQAETLRQGGSYPAGSIVELSQFGGAHFTIPNEWRAEGQGPNRISLFPPMGHAVQVMEFMPVQNVRTFDLNMQRNQVLIQQANTFVKAVNYQEAPSDAGVVYNLQGKSNGQEVAGMYVMRPLSNLGMSYTKMFIAPSSEWFANDLQMMQVMRRLGEIDNALIAQAKDRKSYAGGSNNRAVVAGVRMIQEQTEDTYAPPSWVRYSQGDPFKAHGNKKLPKFVSHKVPGLFWQAFALKEYNTKLSNWNEIIGYNLENSSGTKRLNFCHEGVKATSQGTFTVSTRKSTHAKWRQVDKGRYQMFQNHDHEYSSGPKGALDTMFLDRRNGDNDVVMVEEVAEDVYSSYWYNRYAFNGEVYKAQGLNQSCSYKPSKTSVILSKCMKKGGRKSCWGEAFPEDYDTAGNERGRSGGSSSSSSGSYDTHFGTTSSGAIIFSSPSGSMCSGC
ncbi:hypothetical protein D8Y20_10965 [Mariprofundus sp. EBB-1]|uniref:hypothetical protein n=1 Tax=Mariprofundus sp. EBB-1 TaxID=2650971 RepID=UPI000F259A8D|nr:hypothetical protein [Mariprofundus sp. EBB-1]RLL50798.1 hypothetical protein D8Y20_10965 [Mariprofundus sp. EBB-1]